MTAESASLKARDSSRETTTAPEHRGLNLTENHDWAHFASTQHAKIKSDTAAYVKQGVLPDTQFAPSKSSAAAPGKPEDVLSDAHATAQQKLQTAEKLVAAGQDHVTVTDK